jgi:hypothetical protein
MKFKTKTIIFALIAFLILTASAFAETGGYKLRVYDNGKLILIGYFSDAVLCNVAGMGFKNNGFDYTCKEVDKP